MHQTTNGETALQAELETLRSFKIIFSAFRMNVCAYRGYRMTK